MHVCEESHCGIVPMNHSNKDGTLSAESAEGRLRLKENTFPLDTYPTQRGTARVPRVGECADMLCLAAMYPREEPDALTSARPDLCGGRRATGVPTAIASNPANSVSKTSCVSRGKLSTVRLEEVTVFNGSRSPVASLVTGVHSVERDLIGSKYEFADQKRDRTRVGVRRRVAGYALSYSGSR